MTVSSVTSQTSYLSLLLNVDDGDSTGSESILSQSPTVSRALASVGLTAEDLGIGGSAYGAASSTSLSSEALSALGLSSDTTSSTSSSSSSSTADGVAAALQAAGSSGVKVAAVLDSLFSDLTTDEAMNARDEVGALIAQLDDPTLDVTASSAGRTTRSGQSTIVTLRGSQGAVLRIEANQNSDGSSSLRLTYAGGDIGGVDLTVSRTPGDDETGDQMMADVVQRKTLGNGRLSPPVNESHYSGPV